MRSNSRYKRENSMPFKISSSSGISVSISGDNAVIENILLNDEPWSGCSGNIVVVDELKSSVYDTLRHDHITKVRETKVESNIMLEKRFKNADFTIRETWRGLDDCVSWRVEIELEEGIPDRTIQIKQLIPYPHPAYHLNVWSANERFPCELEKTGGLNLVYGDACLGTMIPAASIYSTRENRGITIAKPFDLPSAKLAFNFNDYHSKGLEVVSKNLFLAKDKPVVMEILIHPHEGCWRPGLGWLREKFKEYFAPPNPNVHQLEGGFMITNPFTEPEVIENARSYNVNWAEIHNHFPRYGEYAPEADEWDSVITHDYPDDQPLPGKISKKLINDHLSALHENNIKGLLYIQCSGDCHKPYAEKNFPDAIAKDESGQTIPVWKECCFANASPDTSFGRHINSQIDKFIADYPEIDGVFLDQLCYQTLDMAHSDGITGRDNKPAAMFGNSYKRNLKKIAKVLHSHNKIIWANGPFNIEVQKEVDGIMAEGTSSISNTYKYLCLDKPLLVHTYPDNPLQVETMFKHCLLSGASYSIGASSRLPAPPPINDETKKIFESYIPMVEKFRGRTWLLEPNPLTLPPGCEGNIFRSENGRDILISVIDSENSLSSYLEEKGFFEIIVKASDISSFGKATYLTPLDDTERSAKITMNEGTLSVFIPKKQIAYVITLEPIATASQVVSK